MKLAICFIIGHKWNEVAFWHGYADCERCHLCTPISDSEPFTIRSWLWWRKYYVNRWWRELKDKAREWCRPPSDDDVPF
jgi:hypothetical protein